MKLKRYINIYIYNNKINFLKKKKENSRESLI